MASTTSVKRPPIGLTILSVVATIVVVLLVIKWVSNFIFWLIQLAMILAAFAAIFWVARYLLRKGR